MDITTILRHMRGEQAVAESRAAEAILDLVNGNAHDAHSLIFSQVRRGLSQTDAEVLAYHVTAHANERKSDDASES